ncbi:BON domain-containing protein [Jidongwangia harbinensis]|uniref:BON domain-containing protein n=1 Tax=Jidongwangia harbinensis TaxID=2878561 RepID=UPI001CD9D29C|nr:BON domain-containing protein [Jidongwangia harbinensis]MCA2219016.1 BON domain-containing protein [Jidongwangia harbinensis]
MHPYWSYFTDYGWSQSRRSSPGPAAARDPGRELAHRVADRILTDPAIRTGELEISAQNGVVILDGRIDSAAAKEAAGRHAWSTPDVHDVCNRLVVGV